MVLYPIEKREILHPDSNSMEKKKSKPKKLKKNRTFMEKKI